MGSVYKQPETEEDNSCHSWRVPSKWKGVLMGSKSSSKGSKELRHVRIYVNVYNVIVPEDTVALYIVIIGMHCY
jgi:hypothetical protein